MARIGLFGGTFNPIHVGHLMIAEEARLSAGLDRVIFIPSGDSYLKDPAQIASRQARLDMTRLAVRSAPEYFQVSDMEILRPGPSYTAETVEQFRALYPEDTLYLILGADNLPELERWQRPETIIGSCIILAMARGDSDLMEKLEKSATELTARYGADIRILSPFSVRVSSSQIRRLIREGHAYRYLVTDPVYEYIRENHLYCNQEETV